jgi:7,8-dihydro-6-hydroxymethylpterin-pyrophosphokinase
MLTRGFVLFPLAEIAPEWRDPESGLKIEEHIMRLPLIDVDGLCWKGPF